MLINAHQLFRLKLVAYHFLYRYAISCITEFISYVEVARVESCVHGFHVYQDIWTLTTGECFSCQMEDSNAFDLYAVAIRKSANVIAKTCSMEDFCCVLSFYTERRHFDLDNYRFPSSVFCRFTTRWFADTLHKECRTKDILMEKRQRKY